MIGEYHSPVVRLVCALMAPPIMVFGLYVIAHGHYGPGGGFAGGVVVGVGVILLRVTVPASLSLRWFPPTGARIAASLGVLAYLAVGLTALVAGGELLDHGALPLPGDGPQRRYLGIMMVEIAVGTAVAGTMVAIFDALANARRNDEPDPASTEDRAATAPRARGDGGS